MRLTWTGNSTHVNNWQDRALIIIESSANSLCLDLACAHSHKVTMHIPSLRDSNADGCCSRQHLACVIRDETNLTALEDSASRSQMLEIT